MIHSVLKVFLLVNVMASVYLKEEIIIPENAPTNEEKELFAMINEYRINLGLSPVPLSSALNKVAQAHARDLMENYSQSNRCNMHSWSGKGPWSACCYTDNHKRANCMWDKPKEIAGYDSPGYEVAYWHSVMATPAAALEVWKKSPGHNAVLANLGPFKQATWKAMGVGIHKQYAVVWFGEMKDPGTSVN